MYLDRRRQHLTRSIIFRHYWWLALVTIGVGSIAILFLVTSDRLLLFGGLFATVLGFCYFVQQQKLAETVLFKEFFTEFNKRYDALNDRLSVIAAAREARKPGEQQLIIDYFNLCAEEYLFFTEAADAPRTVCLATSCEWRPATASGSNSLLVYLFDPERMFACITRGEVAHEA